MQACGVHCARNWRPKHGEGEAAVDQDRLRECGTTAACSAPSKHGSAAASTADCADGAECSARRAQPDAADPGPARRRPEGLDGAGGAVSAELPPARASGRRRPHGRRQAGSSSFAVGRCRRACPAGNAPVLPARARNRRLVGRGRAAAAALCRPSSRPPARRRGGRDRLRAARPRRPSPRGRAAGGGELRLGFAGRARVRARTALGLAGARTPAHRGGWASCC